MITPDTLQPALYATLHERAGFTPDEIEFYCGFLEQKFIAKKEHHLRAGEISRTTAYVNSGCFRQFTLDEQGKEIIIQFAMEDWWVGDLESFHFEKPSIYNIQALEDSELLLLSRHSFLRVCEQLPKYKLFHDDKVQRNHFATIKRLAVAKSGTPEEKYLHIMTEQPQLFQRVPLHYIASYIGIEPESLSRLRKRLSEKDKKT